MKEAKGADVHVISGDFLTAAEKGGAVLLIQMHSLCAWGSDVSPIWQGNFVDNFLSYNFFQPVNRVEDVVDGPSKSAARKSLKSQREGLYFT